MSLWRSFLNEHEVTNKITFSATFMISRSLDGVLSYFIAASEDFAHSNSLPGILSATSVQ